MAVSDAELEVVLGRALAAGDAELAVATLGELGRRQLAGGHAAAALRRFRDAAARAEVLGEGALGRALGELALALDELGERALAARTFDTALAHLARAADHAGAADIALARARAAARRGDPATETAWATAAARCVAAGRERDELTARVAAARLAREHGDPARALAWLAQLSPRLDRMEGAEATWARGELGALWLGAGRGADAMPLLVRAAREEAAAGRREAAATRLYQVHLCRMMLGPPR
jgi:tetratricopeptide (TPR) repeat protein